MPSVRRGLNRMRAESIIERAENDQMWRPCIEQIRREYKLKDRKAAERVNKEVKKVAADRGIIWGYRPSVKGFQIRPAGDNKVAREMLRFVTKQASDAVNALGENEFPMYVNAGVAKGGSKAIRESCKLANKVAELYDVMQLEEDHGLD